MLNITIQVFTFNTSPEAFELLRLLTNAVIGIDKLKLVWLNHDGTRHALALGRLLDEDVKPKLNEAYIQIPSKALSQSATSLKIAEVITHFSISPSSQVWLSLDESPRQMHVRRVTSWVSSLERAALNRRTSPMPTVLEVTFLSESDSPELLLEFASKLVTAAWPTIKCRGKYAVCDVGGRWLFFPKSGYNPNVENLHIYFDTEVQTNWNQVRGVHNLSIDDTEGIVLFHSDRPQAWLYGPK